MEDTVARGQSKMIGRLYRTPLAVSLAVLTAFAPVTPAFAQQGQGQAAPPAQPASQAPVRTIQISTENYTNGKRWFPNVIAPYKPTIVPEPVLTNAPRIEQMIQDGKLRISLQDAIDLALQNNLDIAIQRYTPWLAMSRLFCKARSMASCRLMRSLPSWIICSMRGALVRTGSGTIVGLYGAIILGNHRLPFV